MKVGEPIDLEDIPHYPTKTHQRARNCRTCDPSLLLDQDSFVLVLQFVLHRLDIFQQEFLQVPERQISLSPGAYGLVCKRWRSILNSTPLCWQQIQIPVPDDLEDLLRQDYIQWANAFVRRCLARAGPSIPLILQPIAKNVSKFEHHSLAVCEYLLHSSRDIAVSHWPRLVRQVSRQRSGMDTRITIGL